MNIRERLEAFWSGERPDQIPYTIYQWEWRHTADDPCWPKLFRQGLGVTWHIPTTREIMPGVEEQIDRAYQNGVLHERRTLRTPIGEITETYVDGWRQKYLLETASDYAVMTYIVRHTFVEPDYESYQAQVAQLGAEAVPLVHVRRTPLQTILVDYAGQENFAYQVFDLADEMQELYDALLVNFRRTIEIVAEGPGRCVYILENLSADMLGPERYRRWHLPVYEELFPVLHAAGKVISTHYDGKLSTCKDLIARAPMDIIESLTPPPEGDLTLAEARAAWPDKCFWSNLNIGCYALPPAELKALVLNRVQQAAPDGRRLAFEVSEQFPANWRESLAVVLDALRETRA
ncbi:MAG: hypothetical protein HZC41_14140 [Chloroflexi bacterium]|nr:hypothetical protein [Chloroflexota bacterium]